MSAAALHVLGYAVTAGRAASDQSPTTAEIEAVAAAVPLAAAGSVASTSHARAAGRTPRQREHAERRAIRRYIRRHRSA